MEDKLWERFKRIMWRHIKEEDMSLSDADFVTAVYMRFLSERRVPIIDVNE